MYSLKKSFVKDKSLNSFWKEADLTDRLISSLYHDYQDVALVLSNPHLEKDQVLYLAEHSSKYASIDLTIKEYLESIGNEALPTKELELDLVTKKSYYKDPIREGFKLSRTDGRFGIENEEVDLDRNWIKLTKNKVDYKKMHDTHMVSVNGYFHMTDRDEHGLYVREAGTTLDVSGKATMGLLDFSEIGKIELIPITQEMVKNIGNNSLKEGALIHVGKEITNKYIILVLGGYMHLPENNSFKRVGENAIIVNVERLDLLQQYFESLNNIDLGALGLPSVEKNPELLAIEDFYSDKTLRAYFTLSQSFIVLVDASTLHIERRNIKKTKMPGMYIDYTKPEDLMLFGHGRVGEYWHTYEDGQYSITIVDGLRNEYIFETMNPLLGKNEAEGKITVIDNSRQPSFPSFSMVTSPAYFLSFKLTEFK